MSKARKPKTIKISWEAYFQLIQQLAQVIRSSDFHPDMVIGIANGGMMPALTISYLLGVPVGYIAARSYRAKKGSPRRNLRGRVVLGRSLCTTAKVGRHLLLVDDITDSGETMKYSMAWLRKHYPQIRGISTAALWHKTCSRYEPDFVAQLVKPHRGKWPWISQPMEWKFEEQPLP